MAENFRVLVHLLNIGAFAKLSLRMCACCAIFIVVVECLGCVAWLCAVGLASACNAVCLQVQGTSAVAADSGGVAVARASIKSDASSATCKAEPDCEAFVEMAAVESGATTGKGVEIVKNKNTTVLRFGNGEKLVVQRFRPGFAVK